MGGRPHLCQGVVPILAPLKHLLLQLKLEISLGLLQVQLHIYLFIQKYLLFTSNIHQILR